MKTANDDHDIPVVEGSGNVFADLGLPDAAELQLQAELARQLCRRLEQLRLTQAQAAKRLGLPAADVAKLVRARHTGLSAERLIALLSTLAVDVEIVLRPRGKSAGRRGTVRVREAVG